MPSCLVLSRLSARAGLDAPHSSLRVGCQFAFRLTNGHIQNEEQSTKDKTTKRPEVLPPVPDLFFKTQGQEIQFVPDHLQRSRIVLCPFAKTSVVFSRTTFDSVSLLRFFMGGPAIRHKDCTAATNLRCEA